VIEVPFGERVAVEETPLTITILRHDEIDSAAYDSAIVVETPTFTVMENNDCYLAPATYDRVRERFRPDYAFLGYSPASFFPINFEMPDEKTLGSAEASEGATRSSTPRSAGASLGAVSRAACSGRMGGGACSSTRAEAVRRLRAVSSRARWWDQAIASAPTARSTPQPRGQDDELAAIAARAVARPRRHRPPPAGGPCRSRPPTVHYLRRWRAMRDTLPGVRDHVIAYVLRGTTEQRFYFDFSRPEGEIFQWGTPARYDMCYRYSAAALQQTLDGAIDWDELHFLSDVSIHQVRYAKAFYAMLRSELTDPGTSRGQCGRETACSRVTTNATPSAPPY
jgi:hypothetical protein